MKFQKMTIIEIKMFRRMSVGKEVCEKIRHMCIYNTTEVASRVN